MPERIGIYLSDLNSKRAASFQLIFSFSSFFFFQTISVLGQKVFQQHSEVCECVCFMSVCVSVFWAGGGFMLGGLQAELSLAVKAAK